MRKPLFVFAVLALFVALPAEAQNRRASGEIGVYGGYRVFDADIEDGLSFGINLGLNITDQSEVEVRYEFLETEIEGTDIDVDLDSFMIGYLFNYHPDGMLSSPHVPFFTLGFGRTEFDLAAAGLSFGDDFDFLYLGIGYRYFWNDYFAFRTDIRTIVYGDDGDIGGTDQIDVEAAFGITFVFGGS